MERKTDEQIVKELEQDFEKYIPSENLETKQELTQILLPYLKICENIDAISKHGNSEIKSNAFSQVTRLTQIAINSSNDEIKSDAINQINTISLKALEKIDEK